MSYYDAKKHFELYKPLEEKCKSDTALYDIGKGLLELTTAIERDMEEIKPYYGFIPRLIFLFRQWKHGTKRRSFIARICVRCEYETARLPGASILKVRAIPPATPVGAPR